jgi:2-keto-4-pentenoate hydratase/2-oxohepta-3-ene-1,7-dioic acid hydratase in catechol pathway
MRLVTFEAKGVERLGALLGKRIVDLSAASALMRKGAPALPADMGAFLDAGESAMEEARRVLEYLNEASRKNGDDLSGPKGEKISYKEEEARLRAPVPRPGAIRDFFAFEDHALQGAKRRNEPLNPAWYDQPVYYKGNHREIYGPGDTVPWPSFTRKLDFELEIACVVGKKGRDLSPEEAASHIAGYMIFNDWSARDIQKNEMLCRMGPAKAKDFANGFGPYLLTADELPNPDDLKMSVSVNGEKWSEGNSSGRYWKFPLMLSHISQNETVYPGDILGSGTYYRGCGLDLDRWIKPGDSLEFEVEKLGTLRQIAGKPAGEKHLKYTKAQAGGARS